MKNIEFYSNTDDLLYAYRKFCEIYRSRNCANKYIENPFLFAQCSASTALQPGLESGKLLQVKDVDGHTFYAACEGPNENPNIMEIMNVRLRKPDGNTFVFHVNYRLFDRKTPLEDMPCGSLREADVSLDLLKLAGVDLDKCPLKEAGMCLK